MENSTEKKSKRTQCDYNLGFKLQVVSQVERGEFTYKQAQKKYSHRIALARWQYSGKVNANRKIDYTKGKALYKQVQEALWSDEK